MEEPLYVPENCDFYLITDQASKSTSAVTVLDPYDYYKGKDRNPIIVSRYFKTQPHLIFDTYDYSIYIDGNMRVISDLSCFIQRIGMTGIATNRHYARNCIYNEGEACIIMRKATQKAVYEQLDYYREKGMPKQYGLYETGILVRKHKDPICIKLMNDWWDQINRFSKRDQLSFPYVMWKNGYQYEDIGLICNNVRKNHKISFSDAHKKQEKKMACYSGEKGRKFRTLLKPETAAAQKCIVNHTIN